MKDKIFMNNRIFRILSPILYGPVIYILILLIFDSLSQLTDNFLSTEVLVITIITAVLFEGLRGLNILIDNYLPETKVFYFKISTHLVLSLFMSVIIVSVLVSIYFTYIEGFSSYKTELLTFNGIFLISTILYELLYLSFYLLQKQNTHKLEHETFLRQSLELELNTYKNDINPGLLYGSFETLISLLYTSTTKAENLIVNLSSFYRYCLLNRTNELVLISEEQKALIDFLSILNNRHSGSIKLMDNIESQYLNRAIVPCSLLILIEYAVSKSIVNHIQNLILNLKCSNNFLIISYIISDRIIESSFDMYRIQKLKDAYRYYSDKTIEFEKSESEMRILIPLLIIDE